MKDDSHTLMAYDWIDLAFAFSINTIKQGTANHTVILSPAVLSKSPEDEASKESVEREREREQVEQLCYIFHTNNAYCSDMLASLRNYMRTRA